MILKEKKSKINIDYDIQSLRYLGEKSGVINPNLGRLFKDLFRGKVRSKITPPAQNLLGLC